MDRAVMELESGANAGLSPGQCLDQGLEALALVLAPDCRDRLLAYVDLLGKWNRTASLTAVRDPAAMVVRHVLDSLSVVPYIMGPRILDVGTGPGLPGIPLALACPDDAFVLLDSRRKKTRFVIQAVAELQLDNVIVVNARVESYRPASLFDSVITRAFSDVSELIRLAGHACRDGGRILAMKGKSPMQELAGLPDGYQQAGVIPLRVPGLAAERCLVRIDVGH